MRPLLEGIDPYRGCSPPLTAGWLLTGSESDLRKLSQKDAVRILLDFGITQEQVNKVTDRWKRIDWIRRLCTAAAADGIFNDLTRKWVACDSF
jgi:hypothetical protein